jgi:hypothetical protein
MTEAIPDLSEAVIDEHIVLHKYDGDFTEEQIANGEAGEPIETVVIHNGEIVEHLFLEGGNS